ncbi:MAG: nucleotide exchange factor GrpE, partial [Candidatus Nealsonbacteria bacterium]
MTPDLKKKLEECQKKRDEYLAGWQRARADFLNYKKEEMERIKEILKYGNENLISKILPILDNFEKAEKEIPDDKKNDKLLEGILQIKTQFQDFLKNQGIEEIKTIGEKFNPNFQEVVGEVEKADCESGTVIEEAQKGYTIHGKVLRPAKEKV